MNNQTTKKCKYCQTDTPLGAKKCPNCWSDVRSWFIRHPLLTISVVIIIIISINSAIYWTKNSSSISSNSQQSSEGGAGTTQPLLKFIDSSGSYNEFGVFNLVGRIKNFSEKTIGMIKVTADVMDENGNIIDTDFVYAQDWQIGTPPGEVTSFQFPGFERPGIKKYELRISGYKFQ